MTRSQKLLWFCVVLQLVCTWLTLLAAADLFFAQRATLLVRHQFLEDMKSLKQSTVDNQSMLKSLINPKPQP